MHKATKIKMKAGSFHSSSTLEIAEIYLTGVTPEGFHKKEVVHDFVKAGNTVVVNIGPDCPKLIAAVSSSGERYVRSKPNDTPLDNLLNLPRE